MTSQNTTKVVYTVVQIRTFVSTNPAWAEKAIVRLFEQQTPQEQQAEVTAYKNGRGFSGVDAEILTSFAKQILSKKSFVESRLDPQTHKYQVYSWGSRLSTKQLAIAYKRLGKYAKQLYRLAYGVEPKDDGEPEVKLERKSRKASATGSKPIHTMDDDNTAYGGDMADFKKDLEWKNRFAEVEREQEQKAFASDPDLPENTVMVDGRTYWLGATSGVYDRRNDTFSLGNCWVERSQTIYAKSPVSEMSDYRN